MKRNFFIACKWAESRNQKTNIQKPDEGMREEEEKLASWKNMNGNEKKCWRSDDK